MLVVKVLVCPEPTTTGAKRGMVNKVLCAPETVIWVPLSGSGLLKLENGGVPAGKIQRLAAGGHCC